MQIIYYYTNFNNIQLLIDIRIFYVYMHDTSTCTYNMLVQYNEQFAILLKNLYKETESQ